MLYRRGVLLSVVAALGLLLLPALAIAADVSGHSGHLAIPSNAVQFDGHYYLLLNDSSGSWEQAQGNCVALGGYLASITSQEENDFLYAYVRSQGVKDAYFGATDAAVEGVWRWANGEPWRYSNWASSEPNNENGREDYGMFYWKFTDGKWNDGTFVPGTVGAGHAYICEWGEITPAPLVVLIGGLGSDIPSSLTSESGSDWAMVKQRLEGEGYEVFVAGTRPNGPADSSVTMIDSNSGDWFESAQRLDKQLVAADVQDRPLVLVGHSMGGLIARVYAQNAKDFHSGCKPLGIVQLGTPNKGSKAAALKALAPLTSDAVHRLGNRKEMAQFNDDFPNAEGLPIYRIAGSYFPKSAYAASLTLPGLGAVWDAIRLLYGTAYNDSVVTVDSAYGGPTAGWRGCEVFKAVHANSKWLLSFRDKAGCVLPRRWGDKGAAKIDKAIMLQIIEDVRGVESSAAATLPSWLEAPVIAHSAGSVH